MARDERNRNQIRRAGDARSEAVRRLIENHRLEYEALYEIEAQKRGVIPVTVRRRQKVERLKDQIRKLEGNHEAE